MMYMHKEERKKNIYMYTKQKTEVCMYIHVHRREQDGAHAVHVPSVLRHRYMYS